jgi:hypothetical protein
MDLIRLPLDVVHIIEAYVHHPTFRQFVCWPRRELLQKLNLTQLGQIFSVELHKLPTLARAPAPTNWVYASVMGSVGYNLRRLPRPRIRRPFIETLLAMFASYETQLRVMHAGMPGAPLVLRRRAPHTFESLRKSMRLFMLRVEMAVAKRKRK